MQSDLAGIFSNFAKKIKYGGEVLEWPNRPVSKTGVPSRYRGFESHPLRQNKNQHAQKRACEKSKTIVERCWSGRTGMTGNHVYPHGYRGFESLPLRQKHGSARWKRRSQPAIARGRYAASHPHHSWRYSTRRAVERLGNSAQNSRAFAAQLLV